MSQAFTVAAVQFGARLYQPDENRAEVAQRVRAAAEDGAKLIVLPELAISGYGLDPDGLQRSAEAHDGATCQMLQGLSDALSITIVCGFCERGADGALFNATLLTSPGKAPVLYRKLHLFDGEKEVFTPGDLGLVMAETELGTIGVCVCYDLRFVEVARGLSLAGADILAVPTAWVGGFDKVPRDAMGYIGQVRGALVQANLDQLPMICASQSGGDQGIRFLGSSIIADAYGTCLAGPMDEDEAGTVTAQFDLDEIRTARVRSARVQPRADRRTDMYHIGVGEQRY